MPQHTQGEWKLGEHRDIIAAYKGGKLFRLAQVDRISFPKESEANARLIAAAPKLLEAVENMLLDMEYARKTYPQIVISLGEDGAKALKQSRAAIAAAKGK